MGTPRNVAIIQTAFIGDAILATAMLESWHQAHPHDRLHLIVRSGNQSLFQNHPFLEEVHIWDKARNPLLRYINLVFLGLRLRRFGFDALVTPHRHLSSGIIGLLSGAKASAAFSEHPLARVFTHRAHHGLGNGDHEIKRNHRLLRPWVDGDAPCSPRLYPEQEVERSEPYGVAAPSSQWETKKWPFVRWVQWLDLEYERFPNRPIVLIGGPSDESDLRNIRKSSVHQRLEIRVDLSLLQSTGLIQSAQWVVTNDSGPMHMASAVNVPTVAIFCSTLPSFGFGPLAKGSVVVEKNGSLSCRPCGLHGKKSCPLHHFQCGSDITPHQVMAAVTAASASGR